MVKNVRPIPVEAHYEHMQRWGGRGGSRIKLHPHVGAVRPYHRLRMCDELVKLKIISPCKNVIFQKNPLKGGIRGNFFLEILVEL
jgi:hypothetical protein